MHTDLDPVEQLEHEHLHLNRVVESLREAFAEALRGERDLVDLRETLEEFLELAGEELYAHFDREESGLFPYLREILPDTAPTLDGLSVAHDRICGIVSRLEHHVRQGDDAFAAAFDAVTALFARFDANYARHARDEQGLIRSLAGRLDQQQRRDVARLLAEL
jgi:iron-sulfur cluster repair protein YtfE (RIC family)